MASETVLFKSEERKQLGEVVEFLRQLADRLATNEVVLKQGENELTLSVPGQVVLELKVEEEEKRSGKKHSLEIEIEWADSETGASGVTLG